MSFLFKSIHRILAKKKFSFYQKANGAPSNSPLKPPRWAPFPENPEKYLAKNIFQKSL
jgi:hypothetical protein